MIFNELKLSNFCIYRGEHEFNLGPAAHRGKSKPVVLSGGMNGGGKTSILDAVELVLYGERHASACRYNNEVPEGSRRSARRTHFRLRGVYVNEPTDRRHPENDPDC